MTAQWIKRTSAVLLLSMGAISLPVHAVMLPTEAALAADTHTLIASERAEVASFLARADVQAQLMQMGVDPAQAAQRVAALSDAEIRQLHGKLQELPAGAGAGGVVGAIVFVFIVLLITDILGLTKIFPFTRAVR